MNENVFHPLHLQNRAWVDFHLYVFFHLIEMELFYLNPTEVWHTSVTAYHVIQIGGRYLGEVETARRNPQPAFHRFNNVS